MHAGSGRTLRDSDGRAQGTLFVFDLTVVPAGPAPYRVLVRHPLDVQGLAGRGKDGVPVTAVVAHDPEEPWLTVLPASPPPRELGRARELAAAPRAGRAAGDPHGTSGRSPSARPRCPLRGRGGRARPGGGLNVSSAG
ncbi:hypothetical protein ABZ853_30140 [Streptomyces albidoflavus]